MTPLQLEQVSLPLGARRLLDGIQLEVAAGELVILLGPNGCGKSTLLQAIAGERRHTGQIRLFGQTRGQWAASRLARRLAVLPQHSDLRFDFPAESVVSLGRLPWPGPRQAQAPIIQRRMEQMDVWQLRAAPYLQLSGGERQRVHLARVLCQLQDDEPGLLLLDEPTSALDPGHQHQVLQQIQAVARQGHGVLMVLHDLNLASRYADRLVLMQQGRLLAEGPAQAILTADHLARLYGPGPELWHHPLTGRPLVV